MTRGGGWGVRAERDKRVAAATDWSACSTGGVFKEAVRLSETMGVGIRATEKAEGGWGKSTVVLGTTLATEGSGGTVKRVS
jgi:hypothetical protein